MPIKKILGWKEEKKKVKTAPVCSLNPGEEVIEFLNPSVWHRFWVGYFFGVLFIVLGLILGLIISLCYIFCIGGLFLIPLTELMRRGTKYYVTNQRCIEEYTFFEREIYEAAYDLVTNVSLNQTLNERILDIGTIHIQTASGKSLIFSGINKPSKVKSAIIGEKQLFLEKPQRVIPIFDYTKGEKKPTYCPNCGSRLR
jgi:hypothetical protein